MVHGRGGSGPYVGGPGPTYTTPDPVLTATVAAADSTPQGRRISKLTIADGRLWLGYGDYADNSGPTHALSLDLANPTNVQDEATLHTEQIWGYRPSSLGLMCPFMDPQRGIGNPAEGSLAFRQSDATWITRSIDTPYAVHLFDLAETAEGLWAFGSAQINDPGTFYAQIWHSLEGITWTDSLHIQGQGSSEMSRFYAAALVGGQLLAFQTDHNVNQSRTYLRTGGAWVDVTTDPSTPQVSDAYPFVMSGTPVALCLSDGKPEGVPTAGAGAIRTLPADSASASALQADLDALTATIQDACISTSGSHLYVLAGDGQVYRHDGTAWSASLVRVRPNVTCLAVDDDHGGWIYFGNRHSEIGRLPIPA